MPIYSRINRIIWERGGWGKADKFEGKNEKKEEMEVKLVRDIQMGRGKGKQKCKKSSCLHGLEE